MAAGTILSLLDIHLLDVYMILIDCNIGSACLCMVLPVVSSSMVSCRRLLIIYFSEMYIYALAVNYSWCLSIMCIWSVQVIIEEIEQKPAVQVDPF